jgi:RNA polymerase sigma factor (sigma-70 family)
MTGNPHRKRLSPTAGLPAAFRFIRDDSAAPALWRDYARDPGDVTRNRLAEFYLPLAAAFAGWLGRRNPDLAVTRAEELVSDCCVGLLEAITCWRGDDLARFRTYAMAVMKRVVFEAVAEWRFTKDRVRTARRRVLRKFRKEFVRDHGRLPTRGEEEAVLRGLLDNPAFQVGNDPRLLADTDAAEAGHVKRAAAAQRPVDSGLLDREAVALALSQFAGDDRRIVRMVLDGASLWEIAKAMNVAERAVSRRVNGLLWVARSNVELARYLGVEPGRAGAMPEHLRRLTQNAVRGPGTCRHCGGPIQQQQAGRDQRYCTHACKCKAWRQRQRAGEADDGPRAMTA